MVSFPFGDVEPTFAMVYDFIEAERGEKITPQSLELMIPDPVIRLGYPIEIFYIYTMTSHTLLRIAAVCCLVGFVISAQSAPGDKHKPKKPPVIEGRTKLVKAINAVLDRPDIPGCYIGCSVYSLKSKSFILERNAHTLFHPASTMKLFTSAAAQAILPEKFSVITRAGYTGSVADSVLDGSLVVTGSGDPLTTTAELDAIADTLIAHGIRKITGGIIGDVSLFDSLFWGKGWMWDDEPDPDEPFLTPLTVNENTVLVRVRPGRGAGSIPAVSFDPPAPVFHVINNAVTGRDTAGRALTVTRLTRANIFEVKGTIHPSESQYEERLSVWDPGRYFVDLLHERCLSRGITFGGSGGLRNSPDSLAGITPIVSWSRPLDSIVCRMNKWSMNIAAENLLRILGAALYGKHAGSVEGIRAVHEYCLALSIDSTELRMADGSGVSPYNLATPASLVAILADQYRRQATFDNFLSSLPVAGVDGTLRNRMKETRAAGKVYAKTGTLTGTSCIAGYVRNADGELLAFSILINHAPGSQTPLRALQDKVLSLLAMSSRIR